MSDHFGIFAKYWEPGQVKTRLGATIGQEAAASVYHEFVLALLHRFQDVADVRTISYAPLDRESEFAKVAPPSWMLSPQHGPDLGSRITNFFRSEFAAGATKVVLVGTDSPTLPREFVEQAFAAMDTTQAVLGPSEDGGYYLVGARGAIPDIFTAIPWSTPRVWNETVQRLNVSKTSFATLPTWYDVDSDVELRRLEQELEASVELAPTLQNLLRTTQKALRRAADENSPVEQP